MLKPVLGQRTRLVLAFLILCACTVLILYTGPEFNFALQVILSCLLMFFLFWLVT
ncbi:MAG: hypothetical protein G3M78_13035 [Candidatus Nitrohelix vancouverensis]|uniref:Uncharacterized protein n=1 Tax=Candidatus Nitrohelix vancouverensis TaxID=2705534 RepID=A0A7T0C494_9BACT|nr:MAG: hypothetical protein G3M78_13035 [Candidatus Nitrohelix vancouverensis]